MSAVIDHVRGEQGDRTVDVGDAAPPLDLPRSHPEHVPGSEMVIGEVDGMRGVAVVDAHQQVEVESLRGEELVRTAARSHPLEAEDLDVAGFGRWRVEPYRTNLGRRWGLSHFHHDVSPHDRELSDVGAYFYR